MGRRKLTQAEIDAYREMAAAAEKLKQAQAQADAERCRDDANAIMSEAEELASLKEWVITKARAYAKTDRERLKRIAELLKENAKLKKQVDELKERVASQTPTKTES